ncbi:hypothetical protein [Okeania sp. SIO1I7]|nr:hypothetical protein [Okeania sp. SIO1I7]
MFCRSGRSPLNFLKKEEGRRKKEEERRKEEEGRRKEEKSCLV